MVSQVKIPIMDVHGFMKRFHSGAYPHLRLGQAFCNEFKIPPSTEEGRLFFMQEKGEAIDFIFENFVEVG